MSANATGPAELRRVLDDINRGYVPADIKAVLISAAAAWDADRAALELETFTRQKYGNQLHAAEAALERARALLVELRDADIVALGPSGWADLKRRVNAAALAPDGAR